MKTILFAGLAAAVTVAASVALAQSGARRAIPDRRGRRARPGTKGDPGTVVSGLGTLNGVPCVADEAQPPPPTRQAKLVINEVD
jgi:hypothetical protein